MENLKIRVNSKTESKEAQQLFFELGYSHSDDSTEYYRFMGNYPRFLSATSEGIFSGRNGLTDCKEITLPELRDLVILKRNDVADATHTDGHYSFYVGKDKNYFFSSCGKAWRGTWKNVDILKPIEKTMKEYLIKSGDGKYLLTHHDSIGAIEIPECSCTATERRGDIVFWDNDGARTPFKGKFDIFIDEAIDKLDAKIIWQRQTHPEELPFIDDDFKLNIPEELKGRADLLSGRIIIDDEPLKVIDSEYSKDGNSVTHTVSLNDQYAEIEKVRQSHRTASETSNPTIKETLNQRQSQYGSFEDVAMITEQMVDIMRKGYYENLAYNQKMALYMICSKMARIVNGNPNHKDSWHDIAGYATLIDSELVSEKDMPF